MCRATVATDGGTVELVVKEPRMCGTLTIETTERYESVLYSRDDLQELPERS
jgi:hypothetical protein